MDHQFIKVVDIVRYHRVDPSFVEQIQEYELLEMEIIDSEKCIQEYHLERLESILRLHRDLKVNPQGIDVILHMQQRIRHLQEELTSLHKQLYNSHVR